MTVVAVRPAGIEDADLLLAWANDPVTRSASFRTGTIERPGHLRWLAEQLSSPASRLLIGENGGEPVGQVRVALARDGTAEVGISVAPGARGRGLGAALLAAAVAHVRADPGFAGLTLVARIRPDNRASIRLFEGRGFRPVRATTCEGVPCVLLELAP